MKVKLN